jgi:hypothetical protein
MSSEDITPQQDPTSGREPAAETRTVTVEVPAHRVEQFERFHQRFLAMAAHWDARVGNEDVRGRRGRGRRHSGRHCRHRASTELTV